MMILLWLSSPGTVRRLLDITLTRAIDKTFTAHNQATHYN
jgi:hypothetical protein